MTLPYSRISVNNKRGRKEYENIIRTHSKNCHEKVPPYGALDGQMWIRWIRMSGQKYMQKQEICRISKYPSPKHLIITKRKIKVYSAESWQTSP